MLAIKLQLKVIILKKHNVLNYQESTPKSKTKKQLHMNSTVWNRAEVSTGILKSTTKKASNCCKDINDTEILYQAKHVHNGQIQEF